MKSNNRSWTSEQDSLLTALVHQSNGSKIKWADIATALHSNFGRLKSGKQCRERWQHQLNPSIVKNQWSIEEQNYLFKLQIQFGNKWSLIAEHLPGRTDNGIKNFFYSSIRKVFTKVNYYLIRQRERKQFKSIREFEADYLSKLMAVVDGNFDKKVRLVCLQTFGWAKEILSCLAAMLNFDSTLLEEPNERMDNLVLMMHQFRRNCKKRKPKRSDQFDRQFLLENMEQNEKEKQSVQVEKGELLEQQGDGSLVNAESKMKNTSNKVQMTESIQEQRNSGEKCKLAEDFTNATWNIEKSQTVREVSCQGPDEPLFKIFQEGIAQPQDHYWQFLESIPEANINMDRQIDEVQDYLCHWDQLQSFPLLQEQEHPILSRSQSFHLVQTVNKFKMLQASLVLQQCLLKAKRSSFCEGIFRSQNQIDIE